MHSPQRPLSATLVRTKGVYSAEYRGGNANRDGARLPILTPYRLGAGTLRSSITHLRMRPVAVHRLGRVGYASSQALQRSLAAQVRSGVRGDTLLLLEHPPVFTLGRVQQSAANVLASPEEIAAAGASVHQSERGGNVTFHGPGQLVAYPILDLGRFRKSVHWYVEAARPAGGGGLRAPRSHPPRPSE